MSEERDPSADILGQVPAPTPENGAADNAPAPVVPAATIAFPFSETPAAETPDNEEPDDETAERSEEEDDWDEEEEETMDEEVPDWREEVLDRFSEWLYALPDEERETIADETDETPETPDLFSFYSELTALKQEVRAQTKSSKTIADHLDNALSSLGGELKKQSATLENTAADLKNQVPEARREAEGGALVEMLALRDGLADLVATAETLAPPKRSWFRKGPDNTQKIVDAQKALARKADDTLARLGVFPVARPGDPFDAKIMRAVSVVENTAVPSGAVAAVVRQGYAKDGRLLRPSAVEVAK